MEAISNAFARYVLEEFTLPKTQAYLLDLARVMLLAMYHQQQLGCLEIVLQSVSPLPFREPCPEIAVMSGVIQK